MRKWTIDFAPDLDLARGEGDIAERRERREPGEQAGDVRLGVRVAVDRDPGRRRGHSGRRRQRRERRRPRPSASACATKRVQPDVLGQDRRDVTKHGIPGESASEDVRDRRGALRLRHPRATASIIGTLRLGQCGDLRPGPRRAALCESRDLARGAETKMKPERDERNGRRRRARATFIEARVACAFGPRRSLGSRLTPRIALVVDREPDRNRHRADRRPRSPGRSTR